MKSVISRMSESYGSKMILTKNIIVYVGGFGFPDRTASAQRALENATLFTSIGYKVVLMGKLDQLESDNDKKSINHCTLNGFDCYDIRHPASGRTYPNYEYKNESIEYVINQYGVKNIYAVIAYQYPPIALRQLIKFSQINDIRIIAECTEWYGVEGSKVLRNIYRFIQTEYRMRFLARKAGNVICASCHAKRYYSDSHTVVLPFVIDTSQTKWQSPRRLPGSFPRRFIYAGSPGLGMSKDYIHLVIEAFTLVKLAGYNFEFVVVGITLPQFLQSFPLFKDQIEFLANNINFMGRISHVKTIQQICQSDFFVFLRPENRVSRFGFPTKLVEAFSCGIPTITNATSDIGLYLHTGKNGYLLQHPDIDELRLAIIKAITITDDNLQMMKSDCTKNNPFKFENFQEQVRAFLLDAK